MQDQQLRIGTGLVAALLIVSLAVNYWEPEEAPTDENATVRVWSVAEDDVTRVEVARADGRIVLVKDGTDWKVAEPFEAAADAYTVEDLVGDLAGLEWGFPVEGLDAAKAGVGEAPFAKVTVTTKDGVARTLVVGHAAVDRRKRYVKTPDGAFAVVQASITSLDTPAQEFRDRHVLRFEVRDVTRVVVSSPGGTLDLHGTDGQWWLEGYARADARKVEDLLYAVLDLRFDEVSDADVIPVRDGAFDAVVTLKDGTTRALHVDAPTAPDEPVLISAEGGLTGRVTAERIAFLGQGPTDVGDPAAFPVDPTAAVKLDVALGTAAVTLEKVDDAWKIGGQDDARADAVLAAVRDATTHLRIANVPAPTEKYGTIAVTLGEGSRAYDVFQVVDGSFRVVKDQAGGGPYLVPLDQIDAIAKAAAR